MSLKERYRRFRAWQKNPFTYTNHSTHPTRCVNCGTEFNDNFCPRCGQKAGTGPVGWKAVRENVMMIWGMDNRSMSYTLLQLLLRPGYLVGDYIRGKLQVSFPPVKMLLIVAIGFLVVEKILPEPQLAVTVEPTSQESAFDIFGKWSESNNGWAVLLLCSFLIPPTWLFFRFAPKNRKHTLPQGFFVQVFMSTLLLLFAVMTYIFQTFLPMLLIFVYYYLTYKQLFGYRWWGTLWRSILCFYEGLYLLIVTESVADHIMGLSHMPMTAVITFAVMSLLPALIGFLFELRNRKRVCQ